MNDRVRIYELARQMNVPNQDLIDALRELGYDIKSHSSTIDSHVVGLLIAALGKKKQQDKGPLKTATKSVKPASKPAPPPEPVIVKPRVLSRRKPTPPPGTEVPSETLPSAPAAAAGEPIVNEAVTQASPTTPEQEAAAPAAPEQEATEPSKAPPRVIRPGEVGHEPAKEVEIEKPVQAPTVLEEKIETAPATKPESTDEPAPPPADNPGSEERPTFGFTGQSVKPVQPSVPIRIAAPSIRATPPRPPKSHRHVPSERHVQQKKDEKSRPAAATIEIPKVVSITAGLTVKELSERMNVSETEIIKRLFMKGIMRTVNQTVELELAKDVAIEMEYEVIGEEPVVAEETASKVVELSEEDKAALVSRPPVVTIMGHVDHGKTSLLDAIRQTKFLLTDAEAGGITQHIGAYHVEVQGEDGALRQIVFLDTPGHEAFTAMRARGAKATDIAILVVAADDGVMPQTREAIDHAKAAGVPIIVAVNKIDLPGADPDRVLTQLMEHQILPDKYGGDTVTVNVSAKKKTGLDELLEMILLVADMSDFRANPDKPAQGTIIEAELSRGRGAVATALVQTGTLREGDLIVAGSASGRVRALFDDRGQRVKAAGPSMPVAVLGLDEVPLAGDRFEVVDDAQAAKTMVEQRKLTDTDRRGRVTLESLHDLLEQGEVKELNIIVKADVQGTAEAIADQVRKLTSQEVQVKVVRTASGDITETDVNLAASCNAIIVGFNVQPDQNANRVKEAAGVDIRTYSIIYQITDDLEKAIQGLIQPIRQEVQTGTAEIRQIFKVGKNLTIAGAYVLSGKLQRGSIVKIERAGKVIHEGKLDTLKRFKDDVKEVAQGFECGMGIEKFTDLQVGDLVNAFIIQETKREPTR
jgi:translation initiation factor IF-2